MSYVAREKVFKNGDSVFKVTLVAAKRAVELNSGAKKLIDTPAKKFSTIALEEISRGKVSYAVTEQKKSQKSDEK